MQHLVYNLGKNYQVAVRHSRVAVYPSVKQIRRNVQLRSQFFPPKAFCGYAEK
jgi:hypothetical protein